MKRLLCIWLPNWPIQRLHQRWLLSPEPPPPLGTDTGGHESLSEKSSGSEKNSGRPLPPTLLWHADPRRGRVVAACCPRAAAVGVQFGMPLVQAVELLPQRAGNAARNKTARKTAGKASCSPLPPSWVQPHDAALDRAALVQLAEQLQSEVSPLIALEPLDAFPWAGHPLHQPASLLCDISGVSHLFGGEAGLLRRADSLLGRQGLLTRLAIADTAGAAWGWAHYHDRLQEETRSLPIGELPRRLHPLPIEALRIDVATATTLHRLGVNTLGALRGFPRAGLASRLGPRLLKRMAQAFGEVDEPLPFHHGQPENRHQLELEYPTADLAILRDRLEGLIARTCRQLSDSHQGALRVECQLDSDDREPCSLEVGLFAPTADPLHLQRLLLGRLETHRLSAPVTRLSVAVTLTAPLGAVQAALFVHRSDAVDETDAQRRELARLVDTLSSRLGRQAVYGVRLQKTPLPEKAFTLFPLTARTRRRQSRRKAKPAPMAADSSVHPEAEASPEEEARSIGPEDPLRRPLVLLPHPLPLLPLHESGRDTFHTCPDRFRLGNQIHHIVQAWGPERIETGWWHGPTIRRDYYRLLTDRGECWWVFQDLASQPTAPEKSHHSVWMLHGRFA
jgi:protein ImuB